MQAITSYLLYIKKLASLVSAIKYNYSLYYFTEVFQV